MDKIELTTDGICSIIKLCGEVGVTKLKFQDLEVEFGTKLSPFAEPALVAEAGISDIQIKTERDAFVADEMDVKAEQIAELLLTDPLEAEKMLIKGDLEEPLDGTDE